MSFVPFFYADAAQSGESFDIKKVAERLLAGKSLAAALEAGAARFDPDKGSPLRVALTFSYIDAAAKEPARTLYHFAKYLAASGEYVGAGQLLEAQQRSDASLTRARAIRQAKTEAMRETKALQRRMWKAAVRAAGGRIRNGERGWPISDLKLARLIRESKEVLSLPKSLRPGESTVRAAIRELGLGAKAPRKAIREQNLSRARSNQKAPRRSGLAVPVC